MRRWLLLVLLLSWTGAARAHVGLKDVFETVDAGPYHLYVTIRTPNVIPGIATVEVRTSGPQVTGMRITPLPLTGDGALHPPTADAMERSKADPAFYSGGVWMMASGTWQVRVEVEGAGGVQVATVPVLAVPVTTLRMQRGTGWMLGLLGAFLVVTMAGIVAASVQEARLKPGVQATAALRRRGRLAMIASLAVMGILLCAGAAWWNVEAAAYQDNVYTPARTAASLSGNQLDLRVEAIQSEAVRRRRSNADYLPDHGKLIHLYAIRWPAMDAVYHLHPELVSAGDFRMRLPAMPPGKYRLFGDVVHATGLPETLQAAVEVPSGMQAAALAADDAAARPAPVGGSELPADCVLPDGYHMVWQRPDVLKAGVAYTLRFRLQDPEGQPARNMQPYLGMAGHAAFVKLDGSVFAHTHPQGSAAMADVMLADASTPGAAGMGAESAPGPEVGFPYGFPTPGRYRIFVQMKHAGTVETGAFDADVR